MARILIQNDGFDWLDALQSHVPLDASPTPLPELQQNRPAGREVEGAVSHHQLGAQDDTGVQRLRGEGRGGVLLPAAGRLARRGDRGGIRMVARCKGGDQTQQRG